MTTAEPTEPLSELLASGTLLLCLKAANLLFWRPAGKWYYSALLIPLPSPSQNPWTLGKTVSEDQQPHTAASRPCIQWLQQAEVAIGQGRPWLTGMSPYVIFPSLSLPLHAGLVHVLPLRSVGSCVNYRMARHLSQCPKHSLEIRKLVCPEHMNNFVGVTIYLHACLWEFSLIHMQTLAWVPQ